MKITIITGPFGCIPPYALGAVEKIWYGLAESFIKEGHKVEFISKRPEITEKENNKFRNIYIKGYNRTNSLWFDFIYDFFYSFRALRKVTATDVLVLNSIWLPFLCIFFKRRYKVSVYNAARLPNKQYLFYGKVDRIASVSSLITHSILKMIPNATNVKTINNPIDNNVFCYSEKPTLKGLIKIIFTGRIHPEKGLANLAEAIDELITVGYKINFSIVGTFDVLKGGGGEKYKNEIIKKAPNTYINFIGEIKDPKVLAQLIKDSDIYCYPPLPTTGDSMPCAPLEAMGTGTPIIVSDIPCFDDYVINGVTGLRANTDVPVKSIKECIITYITNDKLRHNISKNGANHAKKFSNENIAHEFIEDFIFLLKSKEKNGI